MLERRVPSLGRRYRKSLIALLLLLVVCGTCILVVHSRRFHEYLLATIIEHVHQATGARIEIGNFAFHLLGLRADFHDIVVHGTELSPHAPLFSADHLSIDFTPGSLWTRKIDLNGIVVDHPVVHFSVDEHGHTNLPQTQRASPKFTPLQLFNLTVRHFVLFRGEIDYNDRRTRLNAEVSSLQTQISFDASKIEYDGTLSYRDGHIKLGDFNRFRHEFRVQFALTPAGLTLSPAVLTSEAFSITADLHLMDYIDPSVEGSYRALVSTHELGKLLGKNAWVMGEVTTKGTFHYRRNPQSTWSDSLFINGNLSSRELAIKSPEVHTQLYSLTGEYRMEHGTFLVRDLQAQVAGGHWAGDLTLSRMAEKPVVRVRGTVHGVSLSALNTSLRSKPLERVGISGVMDGGINLIWRGSLPTLQISGDAAITAQKPVQPETTGGINFIPMKGELHLAYDGSSDVISLHHTCLSTPHTTVRLEGTLGNRSSLGIKAQADDLQEIDHLAEAFRQSAVAGGPTTSRPLQKMDLGGSSSFNGQVQGPIKRPRLTGLLLGENIRYRGTNLGSLRVQLDLSSSSIALHQGQLQTKSQGRVEFNLSVGLKDGAYESVSPISLRVIANKLSAADLLHIADLQYPISGALSANITVQGTQLNPVGQGAVHLSGARAWNQPIQDLSLEFQANGNTFVSTGNVRSPAGLVKVKFSYYPHGEGYEVELELPGLRLDQLEALQSRNLQLKGVVTMSARGKGTLKSPQLEATITAPKLQYRQKVLDGLKAHATLSGQQASFTLNSNVSGAFVEARGAVILNSNFDATAIVDTREVQLGPILAGYLSGDSRNVRIQTELHGNLKGPLKHPEQIEGHLEIPTFSLGYQSIQIANAAPLRIDYRRGTLTLEPVELKGPETELQLQALVPVTTDGLMRAGASGNVDLRIVRMLMPALDSLGQLKINVQAEGTRKHPEISGMLQVRDAAFQVAGAPLGAEKVNAQLEIQKNRLDIRSFTAETGGGTVTAHGFVSYLPAVQYNLELSAKEVRLRYPEGIRAVLNSDLSLNGTPSSALLGGQVSIERLSLTQSFDLATFMDQFQGPTSSPNEGFARNIKLDVLLRSAQEMGLSSSKLSLQGSVDMHVRGTIADPVLLGRANITGGEVFFNDRRYQVQTGVVQFVNPVRTEPLVNLLVNTTVDQFNLSLSFVGPLDRLRTTYSSDPPLPPVDIINLLVMGRTSEAAAASPSTPQSVLAGQLAGQVGSRVGKLTGISSLTIDPQIGGNQSNAGARLAVQQRVTRNLFFTFATDVTSTQGQVVQIEYQVTRKYSLSALRNQNGGYSVQVKMHKRF